MKTLVCSTPPRQLADSVNVLPSGDTMYSTRPSKSPPLLETTASEVWLNSYGIGKVFKAAGRTRPDQPFIILSDDEDMGFVKRAVLNVLSEKFADAFLASPVQQDPRVTHIFAAIRPFPPLVLDHQMIIAVLLGRAQATHPLA